MTYQFREARRRDDAALLIGIAGGTGSGKTYSAIRLAKGLVGDGLICFIDTERGRGEEYADEFAYRYTEIEPPFRPQTYIDAIRDAEAAGAKCIIIDSMSHEWEGLGGLLEWHDEIANEMARRYKKSPSEYSFAAWKEPKAEDRKLVNVLTTCKCHVIVCYRAKDKAGMAKGTNGKSEIVSLGLIPIAETGQPFEMSLLCMLSADRPGVPRFTHKALSHKYAHIFDGESQLGEEHGRRLAERGGKKDGADDNPRTIAQNIARQGVQAFRLWWNGEGKPFRYLLRDDLAALQRIAETADRGSEPDEDPFADTPAPVADKSQGGEISLEESQRNHIIAGIGRCESALGVEKYLKDQAVIFDALPEPLKDEIREHAEERKAMFEEGVAAQ